MILVDSSVWIDLFADRRTLQTIAFERLIHADQQMVAADLIITEVLQGARTDHYFDFLLTRLRRFDWLFIAGNEVAIEAAKNYRSLRSRGITVRKTIDTLIATCCILNDIPLLYSDRDFDPFVEHFGLRSALSIDTGVS